MLNTGYTKNYFIIESLIKKHGCKIKNGKTHYYLTNTINNLSTTVPKGHIKPSLLQLSLKNLGITTLDDFIQPKREVEKEILCPRCKNTWTTTNTNLLSKNCHTCKIELEIITKTTKKDFPNLQYFETIYDTDKNIMVFKTNKKTSRITVYMYLTANTYKVTTPTQQKEFTTLITLIDYLNTL